MDNAQPQVVVKQQQPAVQPPPRYMQQQPQPSVAESSGPSPAAASALNLREASSAPRRTLSHDPTSLQEFLRLHAAFNNPATRANAVKVRPRRPRCPSPGPPEVQGCHNGSAA